MKKMSERKLGASITEDIRKMLFGLGDCSKPLEATALMLEDILGKQLISMLKKADEIAKGRDAENIEYKDILLMIKGDKFRLQRLLFSLSLLDEMVNIKDEINGSSLYKQGPDNTSTCLRFLKGIGVKATDEKFVQSQDPLVLQRELRASGRSNILPFEEYNEYVRARRVGFVMNNDRSTNFFIWLKEKTGCKNLKKSGMVFDMICLLAKEIIAEIVDMVFLIRRDEISGIGNSRSVSDVFDPHQEKVSIDLKMESISPITVDEIQAAIQKFFSGEYNFLKEFNPIADPFKDGKLNFFPKEFNPIACSVIKKEPFDDFPKECNQIACPVDKEESSLKEFNQIACPVEKGEPFEDFWNEFVPKACPVGKNEPIDDFEFNPGAYPIDKKEPFEDFWKEFIPKACPVGKNEPNDDFPKEFNPGAYPIDRKEPFEDFWNEPIDDFEFNPGAYPIDKKEPFEDFWNDPFDDFKNGSASKKVRLDKSPDEEPFEDFLNDSFDDFMNGSANKKVRLDRFPEESNYE